MEFRPEYANYVAEAFRLYKQSDEAFTIAVRKLRATYPTKNEALLHKHSIIEAVREGGGSDYALYCSIKSDPKNPINSPGSENRKRYKTFEKRVARFVHKLLEQAYEDTKPSSDDDIDPLVDDIDRLTMQENECPVCYALFDDDDHRSFKGVNCEHLHCVSCARSMRRLSDKLLCSICRRPMLARGAIPAELRPPARSRAKGACNKLTVQFDPSNFEAVKSVLISSGFTFLDNGQCVFTA